jgi:hypothetical protein
MALDGRYLDPIRRVGQPHAVIVVGFNFDPVPLDGVGESEKEGLVTVEASISAEDAGAMRDVLPVGDVRRED